MDFPKIKDTNCTLFGRVDGGGQMPTIFGVGFNLNFYRALFTCSILFCLVLFLGLGGGVGGGCLRYHTMVKGGLW